MAAPATGDVALLSIHPQYADRILNGTKQVELRKVPLRSDATHVVIYATSPAQRIVGSFEIGGIDEAAPEELWERYAHVAGIEREDFFAYYAERRTGYAIRVHRPRALRTPLPLGSLGESLRPPQSVMYLERSVVSDLLEDSDARPTNATEPLVRGVTGIARGAALPLRLLRRAVSRA